MQLVQAFDTVTDNHIQERREEERHEECEEPEVIGKLLQR